MDGFAYFYAKTSLDRFGWKQGEALLSIQQEVGPVSLCVHSHIFISHLDKNRKGWRWTVLDGTERHWKSPSSQGGHSEMLETKPKE